MVKHERLLMLYALLVGLPGWLWLLFAPWFVPSLPALLFFAALALAIDALSFRTSFAEVYGLAGVVLLTAALSLGPSAAALIAALEGALSGLLLTLIYNRPRTLYYLVARPFLRGGMRAAGVLLGAMLATAATGRSQYDPAALDPVALLIWSTLSLFGIIQLTRVGREWLQGGLPAVFAWWQRTWYLALGAELLPLPLALLGAAIYRELGMAYFLLAGLAMVAAAAAVRRASLNLASQRRSVRELAMLNEVSRAIIRSELDVATLCELVYREAGKVVDTSSFHIGLFEGSRYTLMVRVQDNVRLPRLTVDLADGDGLIGWMHQTGKALLVEDFLEEMKHLPARPRYQSERPPRSGIYVPLLIGEEVIGSLSVQSYQPGAFAANDLRLLSLIADQAAVAITRARAFSEARRRAVQLQAIQQVSERITAILDLEQLLPAIVRLIREHFAYHPVHIFTLKPGDERIYFRASTATDEQLEAVRTRSLMIGQGLIGATARSKEVILIGDVQRDPRYIAGNSSTRSELVVPLRIGAEVVGILDVQSAEVNDFDADDLFVMRTLADQIAIAIDSANIYRAQQEEAWTLNALLQVAENIGRANCVEDLLATAVRLPPILLGAVRCYLLLWEQEAFVVRSSYGVIGKLRDALSGVPITLTEAPLLARVYSLQTSQPMPLIRISGAEERTRAWPALARINAGQSLVALPLTGRSGHLGALVLDFDEVIAEFDTRQINLCIGAARQVAAALESLQLAQEAEAATRLEQEIKVARELQTALLPSRSPHLEGWQIASAWRSARMVGGDFFDFWRLPAGTQVHDGEERAMPLGFVIADVSDKGVPAALFMALSRSLVRAAALDGSSPSVALERANRWINRDSESGMFVTLFYGILQPDTGHVRYSVAGHNPPLHYHANDGTITELRTPGIALGVLEEIQLNEAEICLEPGDILLCYTDGATETIDEVQSEFGTDRLRDLIRRHHHEHAEVLVEAILQAVTAHGRGQPPYDDITLLVLKCDRV